MTYNIGDWVFITDADDRQDLTLGKPYQVTRVMITSIEIVDDAGDEHAINAVNVELVVDDENEGAYEESKANARVTSSGMFEKGDELVYCDGTPTKQPLIVVRCTATCVWFEGCYSMPFNPTEFYNANEIKDY